jgi:putative ABC transport system permease protein
MVKHYLILALRTLWRNKFHAALNVTGLAMGISSCLVIYLIVTHELSFNKAIPDADRIYRIHSSFLGPFSGLNRGVPTGSWQHVRDNFKGVESATLFFCFGSHVIIPAETERKKISDQQKAIITDPSFFETFPMYEWIAGTPEVLNRPHTVVLTEKQFRYYYGDTPLVQAIGKEVIYRDSLSVFIGGIVKDLAFNTDMIFTDFISIPTLESSWLKKNYALNDWNSVSSSTQLFVKREPNVTTEELRGQLPALAEQYTLHSQFASLNGVTNWFKLQPLSDLHYDTETGIFDFSGPGAHRPALLALIGVAPIVVADRRDQFY